MSMSEGRPQPLEWFKADRMVVEIHESRSDLAGAAARDVAARMRELISTRGGLRMAFGAAASQKEFLAGLAAAGGIDWSRVEAFQVNEYVGLGTGHPSNLSRFLVDHLFSRRAPGVFHTLNGLAGDLEAECRRYGDLLKERPVDVICAGIGGNGHLAFNDPPVADLRDPETVKVVEFAPRVRERQLGHGSFARLEEVPTHGLTLTVPAMLEAVSIHCVVPGLGRATAARRVLLDPISADCPATALRTHGGATFYLDRDSAAGYLAERG